MMTSCRAGLLPQLSLPLILLGMLLSGCKGDSLAVVGSNGQFSATEATLLSTDSPTKDEDPSVLRAQDGTMFVAWFSDRGGNPDIYITNVSRGTAWSAPTRVTTDIGGDFNPSLMQDTHGRFHLAWFRWTAPYLGHIWYNSSADGKTWSTASEVQVTTANAVDDWVPTIAETPDGSLAIYFVSDLRDAVNRTNEIYVTFLRPNSTAWTAPVPVAGVNSPTEHDHLPFATLTGNKVSLVWVRHDTTNATPWLNPKSALYYSTSSDGQNFALPTKVTNDAGNIVNLFPGMYAAADNVWELNWLSTRSGSPKVFEVPLAVLQVQTGVATENTSLPGAGYSHRIAPTPTRGLYLGVWVQGPDGSQDLYYRFFRQ